MASGPPVGPIDLSDENLLAGYVLAKRPPVGMDCQALEQEILRRMKAGRPRRKRSKTSVPAGT